MDHNEDISKEYEFIIPNMDKIPNAWPMYKTTPNVIFA